VGKIFRGFHNKEENVRMGEGVGRNKTYNTIFVVIGCCFLPILPLSFLTFNVDFVVILSNFEGFIVRS
jgi:hypothetical protein